MIDLIAAAVDQAPAIVGAFIAITTFCVFANALLKRRG